MCHVVYYDLDKRRFCIFKTFVIGTVYTRSIRMIIICFFVVLSASFIAETKGYVCIEGRCTCTADGLILCVDVIDEELLEFSNMMVTQFHGIVVNHEMTCDDVFRLEYRTGLSVLNRRNCDITGDGMSPIISNDKKNKVVMDAHLIGQYIYETFTCCLLVLSLLISAKIRHNIAPVVNRLPRSYLSNQTFIKNLFTVCKTPYLLFLERQNNKKYRWRCLYRSLDVTHE